MAKRVPTNVEAPPRVGGMGDNAREIEEGERIQLISIVGKIAKHDEECDAAKLVLDTARKARNATYKIAGAAGFTRKEIEARMEEMQRPTHENVAEEIRVSRHRRWLGIITPEQREMHLSDTTPQAAKTLMDWSSEGYKVGMLAKERKAPAGVTGEEEQAFLRGYDSGKKDGADAIAANLKPSVREQAAADFAADTGMDEEALKKAARKLKNDESFMDRSAPGDGFEASEEELEAQRARPSVQETEAQAQEDAESDVVV